jgi:hypothetical protein
MKKFLLIVTLILLHFFYTEAQVPAIGDYRSVVISGLWSSPSTWQVRTGVNTWVAATIAPTPTNNVYIQRGTGIIVAGEEAFCKDLHLYNNINAVNINTAYNLNIYGKIRAMVGQPNGYETNLGLDGTYTGTSTTTGLVQIIGTVSTGLLRFVGGSRTIGNTGEWTSAGNVHNSEFALDSGATGLFQVGYKGKRIIFSSGNIRFTGNNLIACSNNNLDSSLIIRSGAKLTTDATTKYAIGASSSSRCTFVVIQSGGTLEFTGAIPNLSLAKFVNDGTVLYTSAVAQSLVQNIPQNADISNPRTTAELNTFALSTGGGYNKIQISGAVAHTVTAFSNITISGSLQLDSAITLDMSLTGAYDITGTLASVNNNGTIRTYSTSAAPIPAGKDWQGLGATGTVNYAVGSGGTGQTVVTGTYKNLSISNTNAGLGRTIFQAGVINISGSFTLAAASTSTTNVVTGNTINFTNASGGQTIPATNYNNLSITSNATVNQSLATGTIFVQGVFNPGSFPNMFFIATPHTFNFYNSTGGQNIPKFNYNNLTVSNGSGNTTVAADTIGVSGLFTKGVGTYNLTPTTDNTFNFNLAAGGQTIPAFNYYNLMISDASAASSNNTITSDINVTNSVRLAGKFGLQPSAFKIIYGANATLFYSGVGLTLSTFKTSPFWPETSGPTNVTVNSGTLQFEAPLTANNFVITNVQLTNNTATITTSATHNFLVGNSVTLGGLNTSEYGFVFGGTFTITAITSNTFSFDLTNADVPSTVVVGGVALSNITRAISGILRLDGGRLKVNAGNFLRMSGGSTIIRNTDISKLTLSNGFLALGNTSTDRVNITIGATMFDDNEFASFTTPGGYGTLTLESGIRYNLSGSRSIVDLNAKGTSQLSLKDTSNFSIYGDILATSTGTISGKPNANLNFFGANPNALTTSLRFTTDSNSLGILRISRSGTNAQIQLSTAVNVTSNLLLSNGTFNIGNNDVPVGGDIIGSGTVIGTGKIKMTGNDKNITGNSSLNNIEIATGASVSGSSGCSAIISGTLTMSGGNIAIGSGNTLLMKNNSTIIRNSGDINNNSGTMAIGQVGSDLMNLFINSSLTSSNELPGSTTGKVDLTIADGVTYTLKSNNKTVRNLTVNSGGLATDPFDFSDVYNLASTDNVTVLGNFSLSADLIVQGAFKFGNVSSKTFASNGFLNLRSKKSGTGYVADVTNNGVNANNTISGDVWTERFISNVKNTSLDTGRTLKAWRLLSPPTKHNAQTINAAWQEGGAGNLSNPNPGYGTNMSGSGAGFDQTGGTSIKIFDVATQAWLGLSTTNTNFLTNKAYMVFVRGSRAKYNFGDTPDTTVLREKGELNIGDVAISVGTGANQFVAIANPYASAINFNSANTIKSGLTNVYYLYDPRVGVNGGWVTIDAAGNPTPQTLTYSNASNTQIQSGQGFMVKTSSGGSGSITFKETSKFNGSANVLRENQLFASFRTNVYKMTNGVAEIVDGVTQMLDNANTNDLNDEDASKMVNIGENFALVVNSKQLAIENRKPFLLSDTINYNMTQMKQATYQLQFVPQNVDYNNLKPILLDQYLQTETELSFVSTTTYNFVVSNNPAAYSSSRFKIVFRPVATLPVTFLDIKANTQNKQVNVQWSVAQEVNIQRYAIERSTNGVNFSEIGNVNAMQLSTYPFVDQNPEKGNLYYKIKSIGIDGSVQYSKIASVKFGTNAQSQTITISPNPVGKDGVFYITGLEKNNSDILVSLFDAAGRKVYQNKLVYVNGNQIRVSLPKSINAGVYQICLNGTGLSICESLIIK